MVKSIVKILTSVCLDLLSLVNSLHTLVNILTLRFWQYWKWPKMVHNYLCNYSHSAFSTDFRAVLHSSIVVRTQHFVTIVTCNPDYSNLVYHAIVFRMFWYESGQFLKLSNYFVPNITFIIIDGPVALTENNYGVMKNISTNPFLKSWTNTIIMGCCLVSWFFSITTPA